MAELDYDEDRPLTFTEFYAQLPKAIREQYSSGQTHPWFSVLEAEDGTCTINDFFVWSMGAVARETHGAKELASVFSQYDPNGTGNLDVVEFTVAATAMNYGRLASDIFRELDADNSGSLAYEEVAERFATEAPKETSTRGMLLSMIWADESKEGRGSPTSRWTVRGKDVESVRMELQLLLAETAESGAGLAGLMKLFDEDMDAESQISAEEFHRAMRSHFHYQGPAQVLDDVFNSMDDDGTGFIGFKEWREFVKPKKEEKPRADYSLILPDGMSFDAIAWDAEVLRMLMKDMLQQRNYTLESMVSSWLQGNPEVQKAISEYKPASPRLITNRVRSPGGYKDIRSFESIRNKDVLRGLNREAFAFRCLFTFFEFVEPELWQCELQFICFEAFNKMSSVLPGENFLHEIGIAHFVAWMEPDAKYTELPLKTPAQYQTMAARRAEKAKRLSEQEYRISQRSIRANGGRSPTRPRPERASTAPAGLHVEVDDDMEQVTAEGASPDGKSRWGPTRAVVSVVAAFGGAKPWDLPDSPPPPPPPPPKSPLLQDLAAMVSGGMKALNAMHSSSQGNKWPLPTSPSPSPQNSGKSLV